MMTISPVTGFGGGLLIGIAAALFLLLSGRIAGVSGLAATAAGIGSGGTPWAQAVCFVVGLPLGAWLMSSFVRHPDIIITDSLPRLAVAGLLVGFGTRLANGCTSGHGVCGVARLSPRSVVATAVFVAVGIATVFVLRHLLEA